MYVSEICASGICVTFPWWLKKVKSKSKIAFFSNKRHFEIWFPKKRTITFFWSKLSKLHKKDPTLHVATTFSLKQGETRTSHGPILHPLMDAINDLPFPHAAIDTAVESWGKWHLTSVLPGCAISRSFHAVVGNGSPFRTTSNHWVLIILIQYVPVQQTNSSISVGFQEIH